MSDMQGWHHQSELEQQEQMMSMDICTECERLIDTDEDLECYEIEDRCICEHCQERFIKDDKNEH